MWTIIFKEIYLEIFHTFKKPNEFQDGYFVINSKLVISYEYIVCQRQREHL